MRTGTASGTTPSDSSSNPFKWLWESQLLIRTPLANSLPVFKSTRSASTASRSSSSERVRRPPLTPAKGSRAKPVSFSACCAETKYIVFKLSADNTQIEVEKTSPSASYDDFLNDLPPNSPRYAVYDFEYEKDGGKRNKICFYAWSPDEAKIKEKMLYASSKDALRRSLVGVANEIQGTDSSEVAYDEGTLPRLWL